MEFIDAQIEVVIDSTLNLKKRTNTFNIKKIGNINYGIKYTN